MSSTPLIEIDRLSYSYGTRRALDEVTFYVGEGEVFGLLGPNGGGKTTLFRILSTLLPVSRGKIRIFGQDLAGEVKAIRQRMGVVFQFPSIDKKLTVVENLRHQGHLYGISGEKLSGRIQEMLARVGLKDRGGELVEKLSGGLQRRVELAKSLLHSPPLLLLDEPTTGLDPGARKDLWDYLRDLRKREGTTILFTTHLMEEAERCDRLGILDQGKMLAVDTPEAFRAKIGGEMVVLRSSNPEKLGERIRSQFRLETVLLDGTVRLEGTGGHELASKLTAAFPGEIDSITVGRPTLEDVFIHLTGHRFWSEGPRE